MRLPAVDGPIQRGRPHATRVRFHGSLVAAALFSAWMLLTAIVGDGDLGAALILSSGTVALLLYAGCSTVTIADDVIELRRAFRRTERVELSEIVGVATGHLGHAEEPVLAVRGGAVVGVEPLAPTRVDRGKPRTTERLARQTEEIASLVGVPVVPFHELDDLLRPTDADPSTYIPVRKRYRVYPGFLLGFAIVGGFAALVLLGLSVDEDDADLGVAAAVVGLVTVVFLAFGLRGLVLDRRARRRYRAR